MGNKFEDDYIERYVKKTGLVREKAPKSSDKSFTLDKVKIIVNFGDLPSIITFGNIVAPLIFNAEDYNVVLTWKGLSYLYPHADEVWCLDKGYKFGDFYTKSNGLQNNSNSLISILRSINEHFVGLVNSQEYGKYYDFTISSLFYKEHTFFSQKRRDILPFVYLNNDFKLKFNVNDKSCVIMPFKHTKHINDASTYLIDIDQSYYLELIKTLSSNGYKVFCIQNSLTYDMSPIISSENVVCLLEENYQNIISIVSHVGTYIDFFSDTGSIALLAGADLFRVVDRSYYFNCKKYVEDKILNFDSRIKNVFSFLYFGRREHDLNVGFFENIINQFAQFFSKKTNVKNDGKIGNVEKQINLQDLARLYVKKLHPKFISICKRENNHG